MRTLSCLLLLIISSQLVLAEPIELDSAPTPQPLTSRTVGGALPSRTVGEGKAQLEAGAVYQRFKDDGRQTAVSTVLRVGTSKHGELRLESGPLNYQTVGVSTNSSLAYKQQLGDDPVFSVLVGVQLPIGRLQGHHSAEPVVLLLADFDVAEHLEATVNLGALLALDEKSGKRFGQFNAALDFRYEFSDGWKIYTEVFGNGPVELGESNWLGSNLGFIVQLNDDWQVDFGALKGLSGSGLDWGATAGVSTRF